MAYANIVQISCADKKEACVILSASATEHMIILQPVLAGHCGIQVMQQIKTTLPLTTGL